LHCAYLISERGCVLSVRLLLTSAVPGHSYISCSSLFISCNHNDLTFGPSTTPLSLEKLRTFKSNNDYDLF